MIVAYAEAIALSSLLRSIDLSGTHDIDLHRGIVRYYGNLDSEPGSELMTQALVPACASCTIQRAAFSAIISTGELVLPLVIVGITPASTTRRPAIKAP